MSTAPPLSSHADGRGATGAAARAVRFRAALNTRPAAYTLVLGVCAALLWGSARHSLGIVVGGGVAVIAAVLLVCWLRAGREARRARPPSLAERLGMREAPGAHVLHEVTPLLSADAERRFDGVLAGSLVAGDEQGRQCVLARCKLHVAEGERRLTICAVELPGACAPGALAPGGDPEGSATWIIGDELAGWLASHPLRPGFEVQDRSLVVYCEGWLDDADRLAWLRDAAARIADDALAAIAGAPPPA